MATLLTLLFLPVLLLTVNNIRLLISRNKVEEVEPAVKIKICYDKIFTFNFIFFFSKMLLNVIQYAIVNSNNIKIAKNDLIINDNNTSLGSAGLLPIIVLHLGIIHLFLTQS